MSIEVTPERLERRISSDASICRDNLEPATVDMFFDCMKDSPRWAPKSIRMRVSGELIGAREEEFVTILVVPTTIHTAYDYYPGDPSLRQEHEKPEYEFEGWLLGDFPEKIWIIGSLLQDGIVKLARLEPGEETPTQFSGLAWPKNC